MDNMRAFFIGFGFGLIAVGMLPFLIVKSINESMEVPHHVKDFEEGGRGILEDCCDLNP